MKKSQYKIKPKTEKNITEIDNIRYYLDKTTGELVEILTDKSSTGRIRPWAEHKKSSLKLSDIYYNIYQRTKDTYWLKRKDRLANCGNRLTFNVFEPDLKVSSKPVIRVKNIESCRVRLCPMCNWRRSLKLTAQMQEILEIVDETNDFSYLMLTLTVPNVAPVELSGAITDMLKSWKLLAKYKAFDKAIKGWYRGLEVTYNAKANTYHPHMHCILAVNKSYFKSRYYIKQADWLTMWQKATKNNAITQIDIRKIKARADNSIMSAVAETCKYTVKSIDYIKSDVKLSADIVETLDKSLANRRLVAFGGCFKTAQSLAKNRGLDDNDLVNINADDNKDGLLIGEICYCFRVGFQQYVKL